MTKFIEKHPIAYGVIFGYGLSLLFIFFEFFLMATGLSDCGIWVDSAIRVAFAVIALILLKIFCKDRFKSLFTRKITAKTWLLCIPILIYFAVEFMCFSVAKATTMQYAVPFIAVVVQQLATGLWEETASRGLLMCGMLDKWKGSVRGRICMVLISGVLFGTLHTFGVLFGGSLESSLWSTLYSATWGMFLAAIYLYSGSLLFCMAIHAIWDIIIRIPNYFCTGLNDGTILTGIYAAEDIIQLVILPVLAILICVRYKESSEETAK